MTDRRFPKSVRLLRADEFDRVFAARVSAADSAVVMYGRANELGHPRLGLAVSKKYGSAIARNRWKRVVREAFRLLQLELPPLDIVCLPRAGMNRGSGKGAVEMQRIQDSLGHLSRQIEVKIRKREQAAGAGSSGTGESQ